MKILFVALLLAIGVYADNAVLNIASDSNAALPTGINQAADSKDSNATSPNNGASALPSATNAQDNKPTNPDEQLKNDIIKFDRPEYISKDKNADIEDPFVYVYPQSEEELAFALRVEQAVLILKGIFNDGNDYKANINNKWLKKGGKIEGWEVTKIEKNGVELKFRDKTRTLNAFSSKVKIKKEDQ